MYEIWKSRSFDPNFDFLSDGGMFMMGLMLLVCLRMVSKRIISSKWVQLRMAENISQQVQNEESDNHKNKIIVNKNKHSGTKEPIIPSNNGIDTYHGNNTDEYHESDDYQGTNYGLDNKSLLRQRHQEDNKNKIPSRDEITHSIPNETIKIEDQQRKRLFQDVKPHKLSHQWISRRIRQRRMPLISSHSKNKKKTEETNTPHEMINNNQQEEIRNQKALSALYRFLFYFFALLSEIFILRNETWIFVPFQYTLTWENNHTPPKIRFFYHLELAYYVLGLYFLLTEKKLKDFLIMLIHHIATIFLITASFYFNMFRYGIVIMFIHDISDPIMEGAKFNLYLHNMKIANILFVIFGIVFIIMRIFIYPIFIILPIFYYAYLFNCKMFLFFCLTLVILYILHVLWSRIIIKMACKLISKEELLQKDDREEIERNSK